YDKDTGYGSEEQSSRSKGIDVRVSRKRKDLSSQMGLGSMVADATPYPDQLYSFVCGLDVIHKGVFRGGRTVKEPKLAVPSSKRLLALPLEVDTLVYFLVWLDLVHSFSGYVDFLAAVLREHLEYHFSDPSKDYRVKRIFKALVKEYKKDKEPRWPCDLLTVSALRQFVDKKPQCM
ncbi:33388_t:CDS:2, partial [Gigaspora margarita]